MRYFPDNDTTTTTPAASPRHEKEYDVYCFLPEKKSRVPIITSTAKLKSFWLYMDGDTMFCRNSSLCHQDSLARNRRNFCFWKRQRHRDSSECDRFGNRLFFFGRVVALFYYTTRGKPFPPTPQIIGKNCVPPRPAPASLFSPSKKASVHERKSVEGRRRLLPENDIGRRSNCHCRSLLSGNNPFIIFSTWTFDLPARSSMPNF